MRSYASLAAVMLIAGVHGVLAQSVSKSDGTASKETATAGWKMDAGMALHAPSMTKCPATIMGFESLTFTGPASPNVIGTCTYKDRADHGDVGIQVRRYVRGVGESREAVVNDRVLMEPRPGEAPPFMMVRIAEITTRDGKAGGRMVITKKRSDFLIDCFGEGESLEMTSAKIGLFCGN